MAAKQIDLSATLVNNTEHGALFEKLLEYKRRMPDCRIAIDMRKVLK